MSLLDAMNAVAFKEIFFPRSRAMENIRCDVDENRWPYKQEQQDVHQYFFFFMDVIL